MFTLTSTNIISPWDKNKHEHYSIKDMIFVLQCYRTMILV